MRFCVFLENDKTDLRQNFFQSLGENTCSLQPALKSNAPGLWRPEAMFFNAGCKEQLFFPKPWKKIFRAYPSCHFWEKRKQPTCNSEKWRHRTEGSAIL